MKGSLAVILATAGLAAGATPANAITNGQPDGNGHPYVGVLVADYVTPGVKQRFCSGTLVAPRIVLTSGHCPEGIDPVWVSFDPVYRAGSSPIYRGTAVVDPEFKDYRAAGAVGAGADPHDIGVIHLDEAPPITPARLPSAGLLTSMDLRGQTFPTVGYGRTRVDKTKGPNNIEANFFPDERNVATSTFRSLQPTWLMLSGNPATGNGGTCYGDSGGPHFLGDSDLIVSLTATGDIPCRSNEVTYRVDTASARRFLASQGVPLP